MTHDRLIIDKLYESGRAGNAGDDILSKMLGVSNQGGFRYIGKPDALKLLVVTSTFNDPDWPDNIDRESGLFSYFGDNKTPGRELHDTPRRGNLLFRNLFSDLHSTPPVLSAIPPILVFRNTGTFRDVVFLGLAVPGATNVPSTNDLIAVWKTSRKLRFQNYRALFTILDAPTISLKWIDDATKGQPLTAECPPAWRTWRESGRYRPLTSEPTVQIRSKSEQLPDGADDRRRLEEIYRRYSVNPHDFEKFAARLVQLMDRNFVTMDVTRASRDGGRDAIGKYRVGLDGNKILMECALEAKCYDAGNSVGVKELSRLISRLRHRQFGIIVTTSYVHHQAYQEIKDDGHPIIIISGRDIVSILKVAGQLEPSSQIFA